jgi:lipoprotein-releasing system permease protein
MPFELSIALRYLVARRKQAFISVISFISALGVAVGVMAVVIALAMMTGLQDELRDRILGANPHVFVSKIGGISDYRPEIERLRQVPHVDGAAPEILGQGLVSSGRTTMPISIKGIDPKLELSVTDIATAMTQGSLDALVPAPGSDERPGIVLGKDLAVSLGVTIGDTVEILTVEGILTPTGRLPVGRPRRVVGIFNLGFYEYDSTFGFVSLADAMRLFAKDRIDFVQLRVDNIYRAPDVARDITARLGDQYVSQDWTTMYKSLFSALSLEKIAVSLAVGLIVLVAALNIVASLILMVMEKHRDIAILKTMGANARSVMFIFIMQGLIIGIIGTSVGALAGYAVSTIADRYQLVHVAIDVYQVSHLPFKVLAGDFTIVVAAAIVICLVATIYPSRRAARLDPAQALRYE